MVLYEILENVKTEKAYNFEFFSYPHTFPYFPY